MRIFATYNLKGGVGKTASAVNLAYLSARDGARTLLWDLDPQGAASFYFRVEPRLSPRGSGDPERTGRELVRGGEELDPHIRGTDFPGLDLLPADFSYRHMDLDLETTSKPTRQLARRLLPLAEDYDHLFLDCPPSISLASDAVFVAADALLVPTIPTTLALRTLEQLHGYLETRPKKRRPRVLPFFSMVDRRKGLHRRVVDEALARARDLAEPGFLEAAIPNATLVEQMGLHRQPVAAFAPASEAARAYEDLWQEIMGRLAGP